VNPVKVTCEGVIVGVSSDNTIYLWDLDTGKLLDELAGHDDWVRAIDVTADGHLLASGSRDRTVRIWELQSRVLLRVVKGHDGEVSSVAFSPDNRILASMDRAKTLRLWNVSDGVLRLSIPMEEEVSAVAFSRYGQALATGDESGKMKLWDVQSGDLIWERDANPHLKTIAFSPDGNMLISEGREEVLIIWNAMTGSEVRILSSDESKEESHWSKSTSVRSLGFSPDGRMLASGHVSWMEATEVRLWDTRAWNHFRTFRGDLYHISLDFSSDGKQLITGGYSGIKVWDLQASEFKHERVGHSDWIGPVAFSPDGRFLASGSGDPVSEFKSSDSRVLIWDSHTGNLQRTLRGHSEAVISVAFALNENAIVASVGYDGVVKLWDAEKGICLKTLDTGEDLYCLALSGNGRILAGGSYKKGVLLWNLDIDGEGGIPTRQEGYVNSITFAPKDEMLALGNEDGTVEIWNPRTGELKQTLAAHPRNVYTIAFDSSGKLLASSSENFVKLWDVERGSLRWECKMRGALKLLFSPVGRILAAGGYDGAVRLLDTETGQVLAWIPGGGRILALWFDSLLPQLSVAERAQNEYAPNVYSVELIRP
jgi:WD40 repeat protein